jgi:2-polyprenyl-3-methyl-5-hydroxy-6-metoxy-1,4-benzoquinol methylase
MKDHFAVRSEDYDRTDYRLKYVDEMAQAIRRRVPLGRETTLLDFGAGTGLLTERLAPHVGRIVAVDISPSMIAKLREKAPHLPCGIDTLRLDMTRGPLPELRVDGIVSTMTFHHIEDPQALLQRLTGLLEPGGFVALCDIDREDGSFHTIDTGVRHYGFDREEFGKWMENAGLESVSVDDVTTIVKPHGAYPAFIATGFAPLRSGDLREG